MKKPMSAQAAPLSSAINTTLPPDDLPRPALPRVFFVGLPQWAFILVVASLVTTLCSNSFAHDSPWVGAGVWVTVVVALHMGFAARVIPWIPGLIALIALLQWVLGAWAGYHVPPPVYTLTMATPADQYFSYAVPAAILFVVGLYLPLWRLGCRVPLRTTPAIPPDFVRTCDIMVGVGVVATFVQSLGVPYALRYAVLLVEYLSFVGAFGLALARADGWGWRLAAVLALRAAVSTSDGTFHELLLWAGYSFVLLAFLFRWRGRTMVAIALVGVAVMGALNEIKLNYRIEIAENPDLRLGERVAALGHALRERARDPLEPFTGTALSRTVSRVNQGWIISRVLYWTPAHEPYAGGETLVTAARAVLVPRIVDRDKYAAGGFFFFTRFTGVSLRGTSMNLSPPGEMYANFGRTGGLVGVFVFALCLGLLYGRFAPWAIDSPLWWAWAPYVMLYTMQAETGIGEALNHVVRSFLVMTAIVWFVPAWKNLRRWQPLLRYLRRFGPNRLVLQPSSGAPSE
jgi:hypothetical protein